MKKLIVSALFITLALTACVSPKTRQLERHNQALYGCCIFLDMDWALEHHNQALYDSVKAEVNPNPTQKYDIIIDASDSIEGLELSELSFDFRSECRLFVKRIPAVTDVDQPLSYRSVLPFKQIGKQKYQATVYQDWLIDKDYFNQGKNCGWQTPKVWFIFKSTTNPSAIFYFADIRRNHETGKLLADNESYHGIFYFSRLHIANQKNTDIAKTIDLFPTDKWFGGEHRNHLGKIYITATPNFNKSDMNKKP